MFLGDGDDNRPSPPIHKSSAPATFICICCNNKNKKRRANEKNNSQTEEIHRAALENYRAKLLYFY